jgi:peptidoglycan hydrolase-like protein with peptidoglycan-binding domain
MSQSQDMDAIDHYMKTANAATPAALKQQIDWKVWFSGLSWFDKSTNADILAKARRRRDDFNLANKGTTPAGQPSLPQQKLTIKKGSTGPNVKEWQGIIGVPVTGKFDDATDKATRAWQQKNGLDPDGVAGPKSWTKALSKNVFEAGASVAAKEQKQAAVAAKSPVKIPASSLPAAKPAAKSSGSALLRKGSTGQAVADWQKFLGIKQTGNFDTATETATKAWQIKQGLVGDGIVGDNTRAAALVAKKEPATINSVTESAKQAATQAAAVITASPEKAIAAVKEMPLWAQIVGGFVSICAAVGLVKSMRSSK